MELAISYLPNEHTPCFFIGYYSTDRNLRSKNYFNHQYGGFWCEQIYLSGIHLPIINARDYQFKYNTLYLTLKWSEGKDLEEKYLADIESLSKNLTINKSWETSEGLICFEYTQQAIEWLKELYGIEIKSIKAPKSKFSKEPLIFFLYQNSD
ncbi:hypothetical protein LV89_01019 [Arcicella aurantiaca]|uniref:Uncharacterized protein n=1 Tax=Arcicella aurantiaca TaxID=591202 RepID=A0A316EEV2_9BACT|nr:hypothetical protein [Arcicella aurantiaca]PWK28238.1 hypothetical protein LV89_01019 [Arcicella aurantiaca]